MDDLAPGDSKSLLHSKHANIHDLEHCRVLVNGGDFHIRERYRAGRICTVAAPLYSLPHFARAGAEIPLTRGPTGRHRHDDPVGE